MIDALIPVALLGVYLLVVIGAYRLDRWLGMRDFLGAWRNFGACLFDAGLAATLESRTWETLAAPLVVKVKPECDREVADRLRNMSGVGHITRAYKRCRYRWGRGAHYPMNTRCGLEEGHAGGHNPFAPGEDQAS